MGEGGWEDEGGNPLFSKTFKITFQVVFLLITPYSLLFTHH